MLRKATPDTFTERLKIISLGETVSFGVTYRNVDPKTFMAENSGKPVTDLDILRKLVVEWETEYDLNSDEQMAELENNRPGVVFAVVQGFYRGRLAALQKN